MEFSEYENIEIFNKTQSFINNKCENQLLRHNEQLFRKDISRRKWFSISLKDYRKKINYIFEKYTG
jgi:hypothetical protein